MSNDIQRQTTVNIQEKANLIWAIADKVVGVYKPHEYGNVILPMCVIKRFEDTLAPTKQVVLDTNAQLDKDGIVVKKGFLESAAGQQFYNLSPFTFQSLLNDPENIKENFESYLNHFSENVIDIIHRMDFDRELQKMADNNVLYLVIKEFCTPKAYLGADQVASVDMGYIFEELVRKFSESYDEQAGAHLLHVTLSISWQNCLWVTTRNNLSVKVSQPLSMTWRWYKSDARLLTERFLKIDPEAEITSYGQELQQTKPLLLPRLTHSSRVECRQYASRRYPWR
jgi:type I restriction enzyme M protein